MRGVAVIAALGTTIGAGSAVAQVPSSSADLRAVGGPRAYIEGAIEMRRLARCATDLNPGYVRQFLAAVPGSDTEGRLGDVIGKVIEHCLNDNHPAIRFSYAAERGAMAEAMYLERHPNAPAAGLTPHPPRPVPAAWLAAKLTPAQTSEVVAQDFGQCVAASDPVTVDALLRTVPRSTDERAVIDRLRPDLGPCLMRGRSYHLDAAALRSYLAQALYRDDTSAASSEPILSSGDR